MSGQSHTRYLLADPTRIAFENCLTREGVPSKSHLYYRHRANQFIKSANGRNPAELRVEEIVGILGNFGRDEKLADWQFAQLVDAVRILLLKCLTSQAARHVDWAYWKASARGVSGDHAIAAREHSPGH